MLSLLRSYAALTNLGTVRVHFLLPDLTLLSRLVQIIPKFDLNIFWEVLETSLNISKSSLIISKFLLMSQNIENSESIKDEFLQLDLDPCKQM